MFSGTKKFFFKNQKYCSVHTKKLHNMKLKLKKNYCSTGYLDWGTSTLTIIVTQHHSYLRVTDLEFEF